MKKLFFICFLFMSAAAMAQHTFSGNVQDATAQPIPYATVQLLHADSTLITGAITDEQGQYSITAPAGKAILQVSYIGYTTRSLDITLPLDEAMSTIVLQEETETLKEVEVKAKKQLIERHMDKLVLNVANSPFAAGSNGKELLKKAPGVMVDKDGNVTVNGKSVEVYVDGRPSYLSGEQLKAMLEGTDGSTIEKIEIISNPSAKYDASGTGGIINIKTKRNMMQGLNGTLAVAYGGMYFGKAKEYRQTEMASLSLNYRTQKTYTNFSLTQLYQDLGIDVYSSSTTPYQERVSELNYDMHFEYLMAKLAQDFMIDNKNTLGFIFQAPVMHIKQSCDPNGQNNGYVVDKVQDGDSIRRVPTEYNSSTTMMERMAPQHTANLNYTHIFCDSLEREMTVNLDYNRYTTTMSNTQDSRYEYPETQTTLWNGLDIETKQKVDIYSAKLDFQTQFWKTGMIESGVKYALSNTFNQMLTDSLLNGEKQSTTPQDFDYSEHVAAAYLTAGKQFGQFSAKLGLRGEYTFSEGNWITADTITTKSYFNLFPTAFFSYTSKPLGKLAQPISTSLSYTRRIKRPNYSQMNPFKAYIDAHNYQMGNTELTPEFNNDVEFNFAYSQYLSITGNFSHTQDMQQMKGEILANGDGRMKWINFGTCTTHGFNVSLTELPIVPKFDEQHNLQGAWLALTVNAGYFHFLSKAYKQYGDYEQHNNYYSMSGTLNAYLPENWTLSLDGEYSAPQTIGYNRTSAQYGAHFAARKVFPKIGLILNMQLQDIFRTTAYNQRSLGMGEGYSADFNQKIRNQRVMLSVIYMFGTQQWHKQRKVGELDETSRLGSGGTGAGM